MFIIMSKNFNKEWYDYMIRVKLKQYLGSMVTIAVALFLFIVLFSTPVKADVCVAYLAFFIYRQLPKRMVHFFSGDK